MSDGIWSAASGAAAQLKAMDVAAENVANASTPGYRAERAVFREVLAKAKTNANASAQGAGFPLRYALLDQTATITTPGQIRPTGQPLDVAIQGEGYFVVKTAEGERYTRCGSLKTSPDGTLQTQGGAAVLDTGHKPIQIAPGAKNVAIASDGTVSADGASVGELLCVKFAEPGLLMREGAGLLRMPTSADGLDPSTLAGVKPQTITPNLETGAIEESNSMAVNGMIEIVSASRSFEVCERMVEAFRDADRKAATQIMGPR